MSGGRGALSNRVRTQGFTIVELIVIIVVIAILAIISIVGYNAVQQSARDNVKQADLNELQRKIQLDVREQSGAYIATQVPIAFATETGTVKLSKPLKDARSITMYGVFDSLNNPSAANWSSIVALSPSSTNNALRLRSGASTDSSARGFYATLEQTNRDITKNNILNNTSRHIGWIAANPTTIVSSYDKQSDTTNTLTPHKGWNFDSLVLSENGSYSTVAAIVFNEYHDASTRALMVQWLNQEYGVGL